MHSKQNEPQAESRKPCTAVPSAPSSHPALAPEQMKARGRAIVESLVRNVNRNVLRQK